jgi:Protein of unknown function (DUF1566)/Secretion system C-terminal sorting domain
MIKLILLLCLATMAKAQTTQTMKRLPDTGQTTSYTNTFGEDNDYIINAPTFINNGNGTITDTVTTLMWQSIDGGEMTVENAIIYCDTLTLGGFINWRLPTAQEGFSLLHLDKNNPALNTTYFPNTNAGYWWTSEAQANDATKIWCTNAGGGIGNHPKNETISAGGTKKFNARAVRDVTTPIIIANRFTDNGNGTIIDNVTNLMWQKVASTASQTWENAITNAENLVLATFTDWRLPNIKELQSLNDETVVLPSITAPYFTNLGVGKFWSSTSLPNQTTKAWYWSTAFGVTTYDDKTVANSVLCVRNSTSNPLSNASNKITTTIAIYPNPFEDFICIKNIADTEYVILWNQKGEIMYKGNNLRGQHFSDLAKGIYLLKIKNEIIQLLKK